VPDLDKIVADRLAEFPNIGPVDAARLLDAARREQQQRDEKRRQQRQRVFKEAVGQRFADATLENYEVTCPEQRKMIAALTAYVAAIKVQVSAGEGIILFGAAGTGKTHLLAAAGKIAILTDLTVVWINGQDLFAEFRDAITCHETEGGIVRKLVAPDVLAIDDVLPPGGVLTEYQAASLYRIVDGRYRACRPTWATMNVVGGNEAERGMGVQVVDRLRHGALCFCCDWPSYRKAAP
jgi:DNA replication protein DnaC